MRWAGFRVARATGPTGAALAVLALATPGAGQAAPEARAHSALVHHAGEDRTYLIGGSTRRSGGYHYFDDVWSWDGTTWQAARALPFPRSSHRVVHDPTRGTLILFGGGFAAAVRAEGVLWERGEEGWRAIGGDQRAGAAEPELCYDRARSRLVMFGGWDVAGEYRGDTWEWDGTTLAPVDSTGPGARAGHVFEFDPVRRRCLLFGGQGEEAYLADTWEWDGDAWRRLDVDGPPARWFPAAAADPQHGRIVVFGGRGPGAPLVGQDQTGDYGDTWVWNGERWDRLVTTDGPPPRMGGKLAPAGVGLLLYGGRQQIPEGWRDLSDTWELRGRVWQRH